MLNRTAPAEPPQIALTQTEIDLLDELVGDAGNRRCRPGTLSLYLTKLARLGGYLARASDPPQGSSSSGAASRVSPISNSAPKSPPQDLWVIESFTGCVPINCAERL